MNPEGSTSKGEAQARADDIAVFRRELGRLEAEGALALDAAQREAIAAHHGALLARLAQAFDIDGDAAAINVPKAMRDAVPPDAGRQAGRSERAAGDRFVAEIAFGRRLEPWLPGVTKAPATTPPTAENGPGPRR